MRVQVWNCQGAGSPLTIPQLREVNNLFSPSLVFLSETKNRTRYLEKVKNILRFEEMVVVEAMHKAGGMALFWKDEVKILEVLMTSFTIEAHVEDMEANTDWWFIGIYASCDHQIRKEQWKVLANRKRLWGDRWMIAGDFNDLVSNDEKWGGIRREEKSFHDFRDFINCWILDLLVIRGLGATIGRKREKSNKGWIEVFAPTPGFRCLIRSIAGILILMPRIIAS